MRQRTSLPLSLGLALAVSLAGCGGIDGIELNGGVFDAVGLSGNAGPVKEPKVPERAGLVLPPDARRLPTPGSESVETASIAGSPQWPLDPEVRKQQQNAALQRQHEEFCQRELQRKKVSGELTATHGPLGSCDPSVFKAMGYAQGGEVSEQYRTPTEKAKPYSVPSR